MQISLQETFNVFLMTLKHHVIFKIKYLTILIASVINAMRKILYCQLSHLGMLRKFLLNEKLGSGDVAQCVDCLASMHEALGSTLSIASNNITHL